MLITGDYTSAGKSVEVFNPHTNSSCNLTDLPGEGRYGHTLCRDLLCGGWGLTTRSCLKLNPLTGVFTTTSVRLVEQRAYHLCWDVEGEGVLLLGGSGSRRTTELVSPDGSSSTASFTLQSDTR